MMPSQSKPQTSTRKSVGRPVVPDKAKKRFIRLTDADWEKYTARGRDKWLRAVLNGQ